MENQEKILQLETLLYSVFPAKHDFEEMVGLVLGDSVRARIVDKPLEKAISEIIGWAKKYHLLGVLAEGLFYYQVSDIGLDESFLGIGDERLAMDSIASAQFITNLIVQGDVNTGGGDFIGRDKIINPPRASDDQKDISVAQKCPEYHNFTGRKKEMFALWTFLLGQSARGKSFVNIYGGPGIGKSALAARAWEWKWVEKRFPVRLWIDCGEVNSFNEILRGIAKELNQPVQDVQALLNILETKPVLLVIDSADFATDASQNQAWGFLPGLIEFLRRLSPRMRSKVVVTTWSKVPIPATLSVHLDTLALDDATDLFVKSLGKQQVDIDEDQRDDIRSLCEKLDCHPQSIANLAASVEDQDCFDTIWNEQWDEEMINNPNFVNDRSLLQLSSEARELLWRLSLLDGTVVMRDARRMAQLTPQISDLQEAFHQLERRGLIQRGVREDAYLIHYNLRAYLRSSFYPNIPAQKRKQAQKEAGRCLLMSQSSKNWLLGVKYLFDAEQWDEFINQVEQKYKIFEPNPTLFSNTGKKWSRYRAYWYMAYLSYRFENYRHAYDVAGEGKSLRLPPVSDPNDVLRKISLQLRYNTVISYSTMYSDELQDEAIACLQESRNIIESLAIDSRLVLRHEVANFKLLEGLYWSSVVEPQDLEKALQLTIEASEDFLQLNHLPYYIRARSNEATILCDMGGRRNLNQSIKISKEILGKVDEVDDLSLIAAEYVNLVYSLIEKKEYDEAEKYVEQGLGFCERNNNGQPSISTAYKVLLMNSVDVDMEKVEEYRVVRARERLKLAKLLMSLGEMNLSDRISLHAAWTKVYGVQALLAKDEANRDKKLKAMMNQLHLAKKLTKQSQDAQDEDVLEKLLAWLKLRKVQ